MYMPAKFDKFIASQTKVILIKPKFSKNLLSSLGTLYFWMLG